MSFKIAKCKFLIYIYLLALLCVSTSARALHTKCQCYTDRFSTPSDALRKEPNCGVRQVLISEVTRLAEEQLSRLTSLHNLFCPVGVAVTLVRHQSAIQLLGTVTCESGFRSWCCHHSSIVALPFLKSRQCPISRIRLLRWYIRFHYRNKQIPMAILFPSLFAADSRGEVWPTLPTKVSWKMRKSLFFLQKGQLWLIEVTGNEKLLGRCWLLSSEDVVGGGILNYRFLHWCNCFLEVIGLLCTLAWSNCIILHLNKQCLGWVNCSERPLSRTRTCVSFFSEASLAKIVSPSIFRTSVTVKRQCLSIVTVNFVHFYWS